MSHDNPFIFLIDTIFSIYIAIMLLRFILQHVGADFYNPISQFVVKLTQPLVTPARRVIPSIRKIDTATISLVIVLILVKLTLLYSIAGYPFNGAQPVSYTHLTLPTMLAQCRSRWSPYH